MRKPVEGHAAQQKRRMQPIAANNLLNQQATRDVLSMVETCFLYQMEHEPYSGQGDRVTLTKPQMLEVLQIINAAVCASTDPASSMGAAARAAKSLGDHHVQDTVWLLANTLGQCANAFGISKDDLVGSRDDARSHSISNMAEQTFSSKMKDEKPYSGQGDTVTLTKPQMLEVLQIINAAVGASTDPAPSMEAAARAAKSLGDHHVQDTVWLLANTLQRRARTFSKIQEPQLSIDR